MERSELVKRLNGHEWADIEFKLAQRAVPETAYETVSAFSNTEGGWLVFGVRERSGSFEISGVQEVDRVQNDFLSVLRSGQKLNRVIAAREWLFEDDGKAVLVFHIPEARRQDKPVYLGGDIRRSYIRRGAGNERCTSAEIERLLRDAADERLDGATIDFDPLRFFDEESLRWYRKQYEDRNPDRDDSQSHLEFLRDWGFIVEVDGRPLPTRAAVLLFGGAPAFRRTLPRPVVDWQWSRGGWSEDLSTERWADRLVIEDNLVKAWKALLDRFLQRAPKPFSVDPETLQRADLPPDFVAFRESAINLLIHQDYADHARTPVIRVFNDRTVLWNPGAAFASAEELMEAGEREVRNPRIVGAFRRVGLSEQAGTGIRAIFRTWRQLGRVPPVFENDKVQNAFQLTFLEEKLLSEEQISFQASLGVRLDEAGARAFAFVCRYGGMTLPQLKAITGFATREAAAVAERLERRKLIEPVGSGSRYVLAEHLTERLGRPDLVTDQVDTPAPRLVTDQANATAPSPAIDQIDKPVPRLAADQVDTAAPRLVTDQASRLLGNLVSKPGDSLIELSATHWKIVAFCDVPRSMAEIMSNLGLSHRSFFRRAHLESLLRSGVLRMTHPDRPNHPDQAYVLTDAGTALKALRAGGDQPDGARQGCR